MALVIRYTVRVLPSHIKSRVRKTSTCWEWIGGHYQTGYGAIWLEGKSWLAHRAVYTLLVGTIPPALEIDHRCRNRNCVNPNHLEAVSHKENMRRGTSGMWAIENGERIMYCPQGHLKRGDNLYVRKKKQGSITRYCRECIKTQSKKRRLANPKPKKVRVRPTHCPQGHQYSTENLGKVFNKQEERTQYYCRICRRASTNRWRRAHESSKE